MANLQAEMVLPPRREEAEESEQESEARYHAILLRKVEDAANEIGRERVCYALHLSEGALSRKLRGVEEKVCDARILAYCLKHEKSGRLARWLMVDYAKYLPPQRPDSLKPEEFARLIAAMALGGEFGATERQKVLELYERVERPKGRG